MAYQKVLYADPVSQFAESREATLAAVESVLQRGDYILGQEVEAFEREFAELCGSQYAVSVANGTDALIIALKILGVGPGAEVITAPNSWVSSASAIALLGATPRFVDVREDLNMDPGKLEAAITDRTKAILPVHLAGRVARMKPILEIAESRGIQVVEDAAQSVGAVTDGMRAGSAGKIGCFSLHPTKNLNACGDAGVITTNDERIAAIARLLRNHGMVKRDEFVMWGYNSRLDTLQAGILRARLPLFPKGIELRRKNARRYQEQLRDIVTCPQEAPDEKHTFYRFVIQCERRDALKNFLLDQGIETRVTYPIPIHLQKAAQDLGYPRGSFPVAESLAKRVLALPVHPYLTDQQIDWVCESVRDFYRN